MNEAAKYLYFACAKKTVPYVRYFSLACHHQTPDFCTNRAVLQVFLMDCLSRVY